MKSESEYELMKAPAQVLGAEDATAGTETVFKPCTNLAK